MPSRTPPPGWTPAAMETATIKSVGLRDHLYLAHWLDLPPSAEFIEKIHDALHDERNTHEIERFGFVRYDLTGDNWDVTFHEPKEHA